MKRVRPSREAVLAARATRRAASDTVVYAVSGPEIVRLRRAGMAFHDIAAELDERGILPPAGGSWWPSSVQNVWTRFKDRVVESE